MPAIAEYGHLTVAVVPARSWEQAWYSIASLKSFLEPFPGFLAMRVGAHALENGDVRVHIKTVWEYEENIKEWLKGPWLPRRLLGELEAPAHIVQEEILEELM